MSELKPTVEGCQPRRFWLVGLRLDPNFPYPDFYTVLRDEPEYWPIVYEGQIIFFQKAEVAQDALDFYLEHLCLPPANAPTEPTVIIDFAEGLYLLSKEFSDEASCVLSIINTLLDMLDAACVRVPTKYRAELHQIADHLTFSKELGSVFNDQNFERTEIIEALQWGLGAVLTKSMFFPKPGIKPACKNEASGSQV